MYTISEKSKTGVAYSKLGNAISSLDEVSTKNNIMLYTMKVKNLILALLVLLTIVTVWVVFNPNINPSTIVTETHNHISNNLKKIKNINVNINVKPPKIWNVDDRYLEKLGFNENYTLHPVKSELTDNLNLPLIVTTAKSGEFDDVKLLVRSMKKHMKDRKLLIFDLGMGSEELTKTTNYCNITEQCEVTKFDYDDYPSHVRNLDTGAYKPLAIQLALDKYGAIVWTDTKEQFVTGNLGNLTKQAENVGLSAWTINNPTSALTHPGMYKFFNTKADNYYFQHMVKTNHLVIYNKQQIHDKLMQPWIQCALTSECIWPTGAQSTGCNWLRKPRFKYTGCHRFAMSALNIILGQMFKDDYEPFVTSDDVFGHEVIPETTTVVNITMTTALPPFSNFFLRNNSRENFWFDNKSAPSNINLKEQSRRVSKKYSRKRKAKQGVETVNDTL